LIGGGDVKRLKAESHLKEGPNGQWQRRRGGASAIRGMAGAKKEAGSHGERKRKNVKAPH